MLASPSSTGLLYPNLCGYLLPHGTHSHSIRALAEFEPETLESAATRSALVNLAFMSYKIYREKENLQREKGVELYISND